MPTDTTLNNASGGAASGATGGESSLSNWAGPYVTEMLGRGQALGSQPYQAYSGPLTAGTSGLQQQAFQGIRGLQMPTNQEMSFTPMQFSGGIAQQYMNPYLQAALEPQIAEARRQAEIQNLQNRTALTKAGAFGGGRGALMESEGQRNLLSNLANLTGQGYKSAFDQAQQQFNTEQERQRAQTEANRNYGLTALQKQADFGAVQRGIESEGVAADLAQFKEERDYPYKQVQYMQSLLNELPISAQSYSYSEPSTLDRMISSAGGLSELFRILNPTG